MNLTGVKAGDVVLVDDGLPFHALVEERLRGELRVRPLCGHFNPKPVRVRDVRGHWRKAREVMVVDELGEFYNVADDYELSVLDELARKAGLIWTCRDEKKHGFECGWNNRDRGTCEECGARKPA